MVGLSCAEELQDLARGAQADVFLIDINLPGEDGLGLARRIRQVQPLVGIIIISARTDLSDKVVGYDSGADWYLSKPVHFEELAAALKSFARRRQAQRADDTPPAGTLRLQQLELQGPAGCVVLTMSERSLLTAFARAPASRVTPFLYSGIAFATFTGWVVFSHIPDPIAITGMSLIALCGLGAGWLGQREHAQNIPPAHD